MAILLNHTHPEMRILIPPTGQYREFRGGKLEIDKDDPDYEIVMAEATSNPNIVVYESVTQCVYCGEPFTGSNAKALLGKHQKAVHFEKWLAEKDAKDTEVRHAEMKSREGFPCDICPHQTFGTEADLALHVQVMHTAAPSMDDDGNIAGERPAPSVVIPAATPAE